VKHRSKRLLDRVRDAIRLKGYSVRTEEAYADWIKRFILFHDKRHPQEMGYSDVRAFLLRLSALVPEGVASESILPCMGRPRDGGWEQRLSNNNRRRLLPPAEFPG